MATDRELFELHSGRIIMDEDLSEKMYVIKAYHPERADEEKKYTEAFLMNIDDQPTVDTVHVVHAHFERTDNPSYCECSNCGERCSADIQANYCPHCGARMDEEEP